MSKIQTLHPEKNKSGVNIDKEKYDVMKNAIITSVRELGKGSFSDIGSKVKEKLKQNFDGSIMWYYTTVKLDLEARKVLQVNRSSSPQMVSLIDD